MRRPRGCVAIAADEDCTYAMLVRRRGESLMQFLIRLDRAIDKALTLGAFSLTRSTTDSREIPNSSLMDLTTCAVKTVYFGLLRTVTSR
jgi:hypothetical protein